MSDEIRIEHIFLRPFSIPMARPFVVGGKPLTCREGVIVEIIDSRGRAGTSEAAPLEGISRETLKSTLHQLKCLEREWSGRVIPVGKRSLLSRLEKDLDHEILAPSVLFAFESALVALAASVGDLSMAEFLGGKTPKAVRSACLIQGDLAAVRAYGAKYADEGFVFFKLKVGSRNIPLDVQKVEALRDVIGLDGRIRLDANGAWSLDEALAFSGAIGKGQIDFIEEPVKDLKDHEKYFRKTDMPWAIEAHNCPVPLSDLEGMQGLKAVTVKPMLYGGIGRFLALNDTARQLGAGVVVSSVFETAIGLKILANLAALSDTPGGLGTFDWTGPAASGVLRKGGLVPPVDLKISL